MSCGICSRCQWGDDCRLRQPGTWVVECEMYVGKGSKPRSEPEAARQPQGTKTHR